MSTPPTPVPDAEDEELLPPLRHPMFAGDNLLRDPGRRLTRTWYIFFQQLARRIRLNSDSIKEIEAPAPGAGPFVRTLVLKDTTVGDDIADHVPAYKAGTAARVVGVLRKPVTADLKVRIKKNGSIFVLITIAASTPVDTPVEQIFFTGGTAIADKDVFSFDVTASDGSKDIAGIATFTLEWL